MKKSDFYYDLPEELIAQTPIEPRNQSRLMVIDRETGAVSHQHFYNLCDMLQEGDLLVLNDSRVIPARLYGEKIDNGTFIEFLLLEQKGDKLWELICRPGKKAKVGTRFSFGGGRLIGEVVEVKEDGNRVVQFTCEGNFFTALEDVGQMPLPPYIKAKLQDKERYQTVYSRELGSAAAPTAGLHFTKEMLRQLQDKGVRLAYVTLHVGLGTFRPVKEDDVLQHKMHSEHYAMSQETADLINQTKAAVLGDFKNLPEQLALYRQKNTDFERRDQLFHRAFRKWKINGYRCNSDCALCQHGWAWIFQQGSSG